MPLRRQCLLIGLLLLSIPALAQDQPAPAADARQAWVDSYRWLGAGVSTSFPYTDFGDDFNTGYGLYAIVDKPLWPLLNGSADLGWNHFPGAGDRESVDIFNLIFGLRFVLGVFFMGGETGYLSEVDNWGWVPSMGLRFEQLEFTVRHVNAGADAWTTLRAGYYF